MSRDLAIGVEEGLSIMLVIRVANLAIRVLDGMVPFDFAPPSFLINEFFGREA